MLARKAVPLEATATSQPTRYGRCPRSADILTGRALRSRAGEDALMGAERKSYTPQYRRDAAHLVIDSGRTIAAVGGEIGVSEQLLGR